MLDRSRSHNIQNKLSRQNELLDKIQIFDQYAPLAQDYRSGQKWTKTEWSAWTQ